MKQFTTPEQTAKLIELGFAKPKSVTSISWDELKGYGIMINANSIKFDCHYYIGELIEMLLSKPHSRVSIYNVGLKQHKVLFKKLINGKFKVLFREVGYEPMDLLFNCIVKLKEEGVI